MSASSPPIFKNTLQKNQTLSKFAKHRAQLDRIARASHRYPSIDQTYKHMLHENSKGEYFKDERVKEIQIENHVLLTKIEKIRGEKGRSRSYWLRDRAHSLNEIVKSRTSRYIDYENKRMLKKIVSEKPHISAQQLNKSSIEQEKLASSISKLEKYKMPQLVAVSNEIPRTERSLPSIASTNKGRLQLMQIDLDYKQPPVERNKK